MELLILIVVLGLAFVTGANYAPKAVATLAGAGMTRLRMALVWGTLILLAGGLLALGSTAKLTALFSKGIISAYPTPAFAASVLIGCAAWIGLATARKLPVSGTHSLVGALVGAGVIFDRAAVQWQVLAVRVAVPLLASVFFAYGVSVLLKLAAAGIARRARRSGGQEATAPVVARKSGLVGITHWLTSGLTGLVAGMTNTSRLVAIGSFALLPGVSPTMLAVGVAAAMAAGGLIAGHRIGKRLAYDVVAMSHAEGFTANLTAAVLVGFGTLHGLPMSTTHVATGAIAGCVGTSMSRIRRNTIRDFALAWLVTPMLTASMSALTYLILG